MRTRAGPLAAICDNVSRRRFLQASASAAAVAGVPLAAYPQNLDDLSLTPIAESLSLISGAGGNVAVLETAEGLVLVDSGNGAEALAAMLAEHYDDAPVHTVINTHWHTDQTGGNAKFGADGARIIAHEKTRLHLTTPYYLPEEDRYEPALPNTAWPTEAFYTDLEKTVGGRMIQMHHLLEVHTDGDISVRFGDSNVMIVGDAISPERDPVLDWFGGGWLGGRVDSLQQLLDQSDAATRFVPGWGPVVDRTYVQAEHDLMLTVFERMVELVRQGMSAEDVLAAGAVDGLSRNFDDPLAFVRAAHKGLWAHHNTLSPDIV
jgi:glyoxylase-like metal-dependent hydrolase (beta-lactamase superfamily II)